MFWWRILQVLFLGIQIIQQVDSNSICSTPKDFFLSYYENFDLINRTAYVLFDVNPVEGFNLRRDVYIRMSVFMNKLKKKRGFHNSKLVLLPFNRLYHWRTPNIEQNNVLWSNFFDLSDMKQYTDVLDFDEFVKKIDLEDRTILIDDVFQLQHFDNMFENGVFIDKFAFSNCTNNSQYVKSYLPKLNLKEKRFTCLRFQGSAALLKNAVAIAAKKLQNYSPIFLFLNSEIVLHDSWGNRDFWRARRSMRFNKSLQKIASDYRMNFLNSSDEFDLVQKPENWTDEKNYRGANGGPYICAHLRRGDFVHGREKTTPTLKSAASQIKDKLKAFNISKCFISSDCTKTEFKDLKNFIGKRTQMYRFSLESTEDLKQIKDGGMAIIDQIICSHAHYFIGTYESTFTYRIFEEREILGFRQEATFNTFCKNSDYSDCPTNSVWPIVY